MFLPPFLFPLLPGLQLHASRIDLLTMFPYPPVFNAIISLTGRRAWQPTPVFLPGEAHGQRSLAGHGPHGRKQLDTTNTLSLYYSRYLLLLVFQFTTFSLAVTNVMLNHLVLNFSYCIFQFHSFYFLFRSLLTSAVILHFVTQFLEHVNHS